MRTKQQRDAREAEMGLARAKILDHLDTIRAWCEREFYPAEFHDAIHEIAKLSRTFVVTAEDAADTFGTATRVDADKGFVEWNDDAGWYEFEAGGTDRCHMYECDGLLWLSDHADGSMVVWRREALFELIPLFAYFAETGTLPEPKEPSDG